jgi:hypothetical protein
MRRLVALALGAGLVAAASPARAQFDLVELYQDKVKGFEAVYYLEEDETWARDRRVFEIFGTVNGLDRSSSDDFSLGDDLFHWNAGLLVNARPGERGKLQLTFFSLTNQLRFRVNDITEMLHGARVTAADVLEISLGGYWLLDDTRTAFGDTGQASLFLEVNFPFLGAKTSYVLGRDLSREDESLLRFDARLGYDRLSFVDDVEAKLVRYNLADAENLLASVAITRLGTDDFRFFSGEAAWSLSEGLFAFARGGLDVLAALDEDFNASRRGHFGTSFRFEALGTFASPLGYRRFRPRLGVRDQAAGRGGATIRLTAQVPAKWVWTTLAVVAGALAGAVEDDPYERDRILEDTAEIAEATVREPEDELFARLVITYAYNDPVVLEMFPRADGQHRIYTQLGVMY